MAKIRMAKIRVCMRTENSDWNGNGVICVVEKLSECGSYIDWRHDTKSLPRRRLIMSVLETIGARISRSDRINGTFKVKEEDAAMIKELFIMVSEQVKASCEMMNKEGYTAVEILQMNKMMGVDITGTVIPEDEDD